MVCRVPVLINKQRGSLRLRKKIILHPDRLGVCKLEFCKSALLFLIGSIALALPAFGQANAADSQGTSAKPLAYDVISVKPSKPGDGMSVRTSAIGFSARNITLWGLIFNAFDVRPNDPIPGLPGWAETTQFHVEAKMDDDTAAALQKLPREKQDEERHLMLQSLLADRFKLHVHHENKERPIYALVVAKGGFKLKEAPASEAGHGSSWGSGRIDVRDGLIGNLVFCLSDVLGRVVVDKTGIAGKYEIALKWTPDEQQESTKGPVDIIVVDHVEKPSDNEH